MKQILQSLKTGDTRVIDIPCPQLQAGHVLIGTHISLISLGTEKMVVDFGKASLLEKARRQPDKVQIVIDKIKSDGLLTTIDAVRSKLNQMIPMGYCNVGTVLALGEGVNEYAVGDRVVSNGAHAEIISVPKNLCCKIPHTITDNHAAFTILGAIALQGIRLAAPSLGESHVVIGLGLIGLLTVQLLRAHGCRVLGIDFDSKKIALASQFGANTVNLSVGDDPLAIAHEFSRYRGVDGVLITASTSSSDPIHQAAQMCRQRGRIILVGVTGLTLSRADFYKKELTFQVSCSYGPGRYDHHYEESGHDYPFGLVRWTEQRNFEAFMDMLASHAVNVEPLITHRFSLLQAERAYELLTQEPTALGILLEYSKPQSSLMALASIQTIQRHQLSNVSNASLCIGFIGAGNYASRVLIPAFNHPDVRFRLIACSRGISGTQVGNKFNFEQVTTDVSRIFLDQEINTVVIASRHDNHAEFVCQALQSCKHIFVEKPLCLTLTELEKITQLLDQVSLQGSPLLMLGFNRRFSPHIQKIKKLLENINEPKSFIMTVNAGEILAEHWTQDPQVGGGRIIGEVCHFIDLLRFLANASITSFHLTRMNSIVACDDRISITLSFADGSFGVIHYLANGHRSFPKERLEVFAAGKILQLDNYRKLRAYGWPHFKRMNLWRQDKGHTACINQFIYAIKHSLPSPIPIEEIIEVSKITIEIAKK